MHRTLFSNFLLVQRQFFVYAPKNLFLRLRIPKKLHLIFSLFPPLRRRFFLMFEKLFSE